MKKLSLIITSFIFLTLSFFLFSCDNENLNTQSTNSKYVNKISNTYSIGLNSKTKNIYIKDSNTNAKDENSETYVVENTLTLDSSMPAFNSEEELINYINNNPSLLVGHYELIIDNVVVYSSDISNGSETNVFKMDGGTAFGCTYKTIRKCAVDRIHNMNWLDKWTCIAEGLNCVLYQMASCAIDIC